MKRTIFNDSYQFNNESYKGSFGRKGYKANLVSGEAL